CSRNLATVFRRRFARTWWKDGSAARLRRLFRQLLRPNELPSSRTSCEEHILMTKDDVMSDAVHARPRATDLVLDDEKNVCAFVRATLPEWGFQTVWAPTVDRAVAAIAEERPDLALVDIDLRGDGTGWDLLRHVRSNSETESMPVVMLTGSADTLDREKSLRMGADRYLLKPVRPETLRRVVHEVLAARDDIWWSLTLRPDQVQRLRELFYDATTEVPTLAVVVDDLRRIVESGETLAVFCL